MVLFFVIFISLLIIGGFIGWIIKDKNNSNEDFLFPGWLIGAIAGLLISLFIGLILEETVTTEETIIIKEYSFNEFGGIRLVYNSGQIENIDCDNIYVLETDNNVISVVIKKRYITMETSKITLYIPKNMKAESGEPVTEDCTCSLDKENSDNTFACDKCGFSNFLDFKFCPECGTELN